MRVKLVCILISCASLLLGQIGWRPLAEAPNLTGALSKLDDVHFINAEIGWTLNSLGEVFKTVDGGNSWENLGDLGEFLRCIQFANEDVGYVGSLQGNFGGPPSSAKIFKTIDGGDNWTDLTSLIDPEPIGVCGISVVSEDIVFGCGAFYGPARVYKTLDGGDSWVNIDMSDYAQALVDVYFHNELEGYVVGFGDVDNPGGVILKTVDGGETWSRIYSDEETGLLWKIQILDEEHIFASVAGVNLEGGARILVSDDAGENWEVKQVPIDGTQLQGVGFLTPDHGFTGGFFNGLYETIDGGDNWTLIDVGANYNRFQKINDSLMYASGHTIYKYSDDLMTSTRQEVVKAPNYGLKIYPNPVDDRLEVNYTLGNHTHLNLSLYDHKGRLVHTFYDGWHQEGEFNAELETTPLSPGFYLMALLTREGDIMKKVLIQH
ncbi:MAG: T9SS type A sorting domain-containing protein [Bacteroidota bacterium]